MPREYKVFLQDIKAAINKIKEYTKDLSLDDFRQNNLVIDGVVRNLEIIGEAAKNIPTEVKNQHKQINWKKISGLRDILIHQYFGIDIEIIWDIVKNKLPELNSLISAIEL